MPFPAIKSVDCVFFPRVCPSLLHLACFSSCFLFAQVLTVLCSPVVLSALAPGTGVAVYAGLVGALLLCVILVLCVGVLAYRRRCRHLHGDITDSSSALTAAFHPGNYKPPRQGRFTQTLNRTPAWTQVIIKSVPLCLFAKLFPLVLIFIETLFDN